MKTLNLLYRKNSKGTIEVYAMSIHDAYGVNPARYELLLGSYNQYLAGKLKPRVSYVYKGVNIGKSNEKDAYTNAIDIAIKKHKDKQDREGWITINTLIEKHNLSLDLDKEKVLEYLSIEPVVDNFGNKKPMLAKSKYSTKTGEIETVIEYPKYGQPKFNGVRCFVSLEEIEIGEGLFASREILPVLRSREGLEYTAPITLIKSFIKLFNILKFNNYNANEIVFDGEIYVQDWSLQRIVSAVKTENENTPNLEFWCYDLAIPNVSQKERLKLLKDIFIINSQVVEPTSITFNNSHLLLGVRYNNIIRVVSHLIKNDEDAKQFFELFINNDFEGQIYRDINATYAFGKRTKALIKEKRWIDEEYQIVDIITSGKDHYEGNPIGKYKCITNDGQQFDVTPALTKKERYYLLKDRAKYIGKLLTVRFYEYTDLGLPRHAIALIVRDYE